jgi:23S rRNA pseudouridine2605 synthase
MNLPGRNNGPEAFCLPCRDVAPIASPMPEDSAVRLNKFLAEAGIASRRGADALIQAGRVTVNGAVQREPGTRVAPGRDQVAFDGSPVACAQGAAAVYVMLHKPVHTVTTVRDPQGRKTVLDLLPEDLRAQRLFPVGRLDYMSEGLLLLTNDGEVTLRTGMRLREGERLAPVDVQASTERNGATMLRMTLRQGVNRQIRRMCRDLGLTILRLRRTDLGPLKLGGLASGKWRHLSAGEILQLKASLGMAQGTDNA